MGEDWTPHLSDIQSPNSKISSIAFSPTDNVISSMGLYGTVTLLDYVTATERFGFFEEGALCQYYVAGTMDFSPDGKLIAIVKSGGPVTIRDPIQRTMMKLGYEDWQQRTVIEVTFSPKDSNMVAATSQGCALGTTTCTKLGEFRCAKLHVTMGYREEKPDSDLCRPSRPYNEACILS